MKDFPGGRSLSDPAPRAGWWIALFLVLVILAGIGHVIYQYLTGGAPQIQLVGEAKGIGRSTKLSVHATDRRGLRRFEASLEQNGQIIPVMAESYGSQWSLLNSGPTDLSKELELGTRHQPALKDGAVTLRLRAANRKWLGGETALDVPLVVRSQPPTIEVRSGLLYINQGGSEMALYRVSDTAVESGVRVGTYFFPGFPRAGGQPGDRIALFAFPYDAPPETPAQIVARDEAGNEAVARFPHRVMPKTFRRRDIVIDDSFLQSVVPAILSHTPDLQDQGDLLKNFLMMNGTLRERNRQRMAEIARQTASEMLWEGPFLQLANSAVESQFADHRSYFYRGEKVDEQTHLGFDLATVQHDAVKASNSGVVVFAGYLGIFGNTIILDHGLGLQTLYSHLSSFSVKAGDKVAKGQEIARSGSTGLAGGDHLHFTTLLHGLEVNPIEWWDERWVRQHILEKLAPVPPPAP
ncbi:MAG TPA: M23 family metallopeptidase [Terriglobia bacterium]|nr:M23 family metallopeptidase [Terriglobia bacterium]